MSKVLDLSGREARIKDKPSVFISVFVIDWVLLRSGDVVVLHGLGHSDQLEPTIPTSFISM